MLRDVLIVCLVAGLALISLPIGIMAQDRPTSSSLGPFPVDRYNYGNVQGEMAKWARMTTTSYGFLKLTNSARGAAMGDAYSAVGNDVSGLFYNPAAIAHIDRYEMEGQYTNWLVGSQMGSFVIGAKTGLATFAFNLAYFTTEEIEETTSAQPGGTGRFITYGDIAVGMAVAKQVTDKLMVGGNIRWIKEDLFLQSYSAIDVDFGTLFYTGYKSTRLGMSLRNLGTDQEVISQKARLPVAFNLSGAAEIYGNIGDPFSLTVAAEQVFFTDANNKYHVGAEAWIENMIAIRAGVKSGYDNESVSFGAGLKQKFVGDQEVRIDFSWSKAEQMDETPVRMSIGVGF